MPFGSITSHIDAAETAVWIFFIGFAIVVYFLRKMDKREGYPMKASPFDPTPLLGFPPPAEPTAFRMMEGGETVAPHHEPEPPTTAVPFDRFDGTPLVPTGDLLTTPLGPGAWTMRREEPLVTETGESMLQPMRLLPEWSVLHGDLDLRGRPVLDRRFFRAGIVRDLWIDRSAKMIRLFEVTLDEPAQRSVLVPIWHTDIRQHDREIRVTALLAAQFGGIPRPEHPDELGAREHARIDAYFAAAHFYRDAEIGPATTPDERRWLP